MKVFELEAVWASNDDENLDKLEELGVDVSKDRKEDTGPITIRKRDITAFNDTTNPMRTRIWLRGGLEAVLVNIPYEEFRKLYSLKV